VCHIPIISGLNWALGFQNSRIRESMSQISQHRFAAQLGLLLTGTLLWGGPAEALRESSTPFLVRQWQTEQGLPHNSIPAIAQTRDGYLWLGTEHGLARFDGVQCRVFGLRDGLDCLDISALLGDSQGGLWIGTASGGVSRYADGAIQTFTAKDGLVGQSIYALLEDANGGVWIGSATGLSCRRNGRFTQMAKELGPIFVRALGKDREGTVWAATLLNGLLWFRGERFQAVTGPAGMETITAYSLLVDKSDRLWASLRDGGVLCCDKGGWSRYGPAEGLPRTIIRGLAQTSDGTLWAGSMDEGVYYLDNGKFRGLREKDGLSDGTILSLFVDREQNVWAGTRSDGLNRLSPKRLSVCRVLAESSERVPLALAETRDGELWVSVLGRGIFHWNGGQFDQPLHGPHVGNHLFVSALLGASDGSLWWAAGPAFFQWKDGKLISDYGHEPWLRGDQILSLCEDRGGGIWIGTHNGQLRLLRQGQSTALGGLSGSPVAALTQAPDGTLWIGSLGGGLASLRGGTLSALTRKDGLQSNLIRTLLLDSEGTLWIGTVGGGLARWSLGRLTSFTAQQGLMDDTVLQILEDDNGCLWLGGSRGICCVSKQELEQVAKGKLAAIHPRTYGRAEGMISEQCEDNFAASLKTRAGHLCFSTARGIVIIDPKQQATNSEPPAVLVENVLVDGSAQASLLEAPAGPGGKGSAGFRPGAAAVPRISPGRHRFEFHYTGLSFDAPEKIQFRYCLGGLDAGWSEAGPGRVAVYGYVPPGAYRFRVIACNRDGVWNQTGAAVSFIVLPHFWQTHWFAGLAVLAGAGLVAGGIRLLERRRYRRRLALLEMERAMERERSRIAGDLHDELGSSLTRISMLSDPTQRPQTSPDQLKSRLNRISEVAVRTTQSLDEIVWAMSPANDSLRSLLEYLSQLARELFEDTEVHCRFEIPADLPGTPMAPDLRHDIFLAVKEALTNVIRHAHAKEVFLRSQIDGPRIEILVQDDGVGFNPDSPAARMRHGLKSMRQRVEGLGGQFEVSSAPGEGTRIRIIVNGSTTPASGAPPRHSSAQPCACARPPDSSLF
jgi:signal transduction histidine kinase/ligand-binding sensor domain-containing protein